MGNKNFGSGNDTQFTEVTAYRKPIKSTYRAYYTHQEMPQIGYKFGFELNALRLDPKSYIPKIEELFINKINQDNYHSETSEYFVEGKAGFEIAIKYLGNPSAQGNINKPFAIEIESGLCFSAYLLAKYCGNRETVDLKHEDDAVVSECMNLYGNNLNSRTGHTHLSVVSCDPTGILIQILADDGGVIRKNRDMLFNPVFKFFGIGVCWSEKENLFYVSVVFAEEYFSEMQKVPDNEVKEMLQHISEGECTNDQIVLHGRDEIAKNKAAVNKNNNAFTKDGKPIVNEEPVGLQ